MLASHVLCEGGGGDEGCTAEAVWVEGELLSCKFNKGGSGPGGETWVTNGGDDAHIFDTVPYQIACNFDKVMKLAATKRTLGPNEYFYFMHNEIISAQAKNCFDEDFRKMLEEDGDRNSDDQDGRWTDVSVEIFIMPSLVWRDVSGVQFGDQRPMSNSWEGCFIGNNSFIKTVNILNFIIRLLIIVPISSMRTPLWVLDLNFRENTHFTCRVHPRPKSSYCVFLLHCFPL